MNTYRIIGKKDDWKDDKEKSPSGRKGLILSAGKGSSKLHISGQNGTGEASTEARAREIQLLAGKALSHAADGLSVALEG